MNSVDSLATRRARNSEEAACGQGSDRRSSASKELPLEADAAPILPLPSMAPALLLAWADVLENLPDAVFMIAAHDRAGRILYLNSLAARMFGYERGELVDQSIDVLVPEHLREHHLSHRRVFADNPKLRRSGAGLELLDRRRDGTEFPIDVLLNPTTTARHRARLRSCAI
jgi:PAS domain S-box-containing protein